MPGQLAQRLRHQPRLHPIGGSPISLPAPPSERIAATESTTTDCPRRRANQRFASPAPPPPVSGATPANCPSTPSFRAKPDRRRVAPRQGTLPGPRASALRRSRACHRRVAARFRRNSITRPRGNPPTPSAASIESIRLYYTDGTIHRRWPIRMIAPLTMVLFDLRIAAASNRAFSSSFSHLKWRTGRSRLGRAPVQSLTFRQL